MESNKNQSKISKAFQDQKKVKIKKNDGRLIGGIPNYADSNGSPDWYLEGENGNREWVNLDDIQDVDILD